MFLDLVAYLQRHNQPGEALWDTAQRILVTRCVHEERTQAEAAEVLGCSERSMCYYVKKKYRLGETNK